MKFFNLFKRIGVKLITAFLLIGIIPLLVSSFISSQKSSAALSKASFNQLSGVREIKKSQIESFFHERKGDMGVLMETVNTLRAEAFNKLEAKHDLKTAMLKDYFDKALLDMKMFAHSKDVEMLYDSLVKYHKDTFVTAEGAYNVKTS